MKLLWLSRHRLLPVQRAALVAKWPEVEIIEDRAWQAALTGPVAPVVARMRAERIDEVAMVAPLSVVQRFVEAGLRPLWAEMIEAKRGERPDLTLPDGRGFRFAGWRRVRRLALEFDDL